MDKLALIRATIAAIGLTLQRLNDKLIEAPLTTDTKQHAIDEAITAEIGAALIATSFAKELEWSATDLLSRKEEIMDMINEADDIPTTKMSVEDFINQRNNADNN